MSQSGGKSPKTAGTADLSGRHLGDFHLLRRLGRGAMAEVYLAEQCALSRRVALKILKPELANDRTYLQRFRREAQAAAALVHANIVQIHEVGQVDSYHYIAQEYVEGLNLREWIARNGPPDLPRALSILRQVAAALVKAAQQGVVHRDIKPENIMLTRAGEVKVADFGLAHFSTGAEELGLTQEGMTLGTPLYMSPEQVEGKPLDPRSDLYSLGVTCYHMLAGAPPFSGDTALAVAVQHLNTDAKPLAEVRTDLPAGLCAIVHKMLAKRPDDRYASAQELLREIRRVQVEHFGSHWPDDLPGWEAGGPDLAGTQLNSELTQHLDALMKTTALPSPSRTFWLLLAGALLLAFAIGGMMAWLIGTDRPLLASASAAKPAVPHQSRAFEQWWLANQMGTEEAWRAVIDYFPKSESYIRRAKQQLARIYLREGNYNKALEIFDDFAKLEDEAEFRAFGLAGKCGVLSLQGDYQGSVQVLEELWPIRGYLNDRQLQQMLNYTLKRNREKLGPQTRQQWQQWLAEQFRQSD